jgi:CubicO group peptidase (beta-lactamase class C family)
LAAAPGAAWPQAGSAIAGWSPAADAAGGLDQLHALVIAHKGEIALAEAFRGPPVDRPVNVKSVSKTLVAALTGAAIDRGEIDGPDQTLGALVPELIPGSADTRVRSITIENLLTMQAGLQRTSGPNYGNWISSPNWVAYVLSRPFVMPPGEAMQYSTGSFHVLGAVLARIAGKSLLDLARERLGAPLGIEIPAWTRDPQGYYLGGNEMALSPLAMIRFGELYRQGGVWEDARVISDGWVETSFVPRTRSRFSGLEYGYGWFLGELQGHMSAIARGYGGQVICVVPALRLTVAITSDPTRPARSGGYFGDLMDLISGHIIPAVAAAD